MLTIISRYKLGKIFIFLTTHSIHSHTQHPVISTHHTTPPTMPSNTVTTKMQKPKAQMVGGRRRGSPPRARRATKSTKKKASPTTDGIESPTLAGIASFLDSFITPDGGILMEAPEPTVEDTRRLQAPPRHKMPKHHNNINNKNQSRRSRHAIGQPRSNGGNH